MSARAVQRVIRRGARRVREARMVARALASNRHPILAQIVPTRRCNLSCAYCNEYDKTSEPVPTATMLQRIDRLAALGTSIVDLSGGEPLLHPEVDVLIRRIRERGMLAGLLTSQGALPIEIPRSAPRLVAMRRLAGRVLGGR